MHMTEYTFRLGSLNDKEGILNFLRIYWDPEHIYLKNNNILFDNDFLVADRYNFLLAVNKEYQIEGILGFIQYNPTLEGSNVFTVLWKVKPNLGNPSLGIELLENLIHNYGINSVSTVGANSRTLPIYEYLRYKTGRLNHYFMINEKLDSFSILKAIPLIRNSSETVSEIRELIELDTFKKFEAAYCSPHYKKTGICKSLWYINKRFFNHPVYVYRAFGIAAQGKINTIIIAREVVANDSKILRIIDISGDADELRFTGSLFKGLLADNNYEYLDLYEYGIDKNVLNNGGFSLRSDFPTLVIPNYFEPFEFSNIDINFFTTASEKSTFFKGDGDQDRPNIYP